MKSAGGLTWCSYYCAYVCQDIQTGRTFLITGASNESCALSLLIGLRGSRLSLFMRYGPKPKGSFGRERTGDVPAMRSGIRDQGKGDKMAFGTTVVPKAILSPCPRSLIPLRIAGVPRHRFALVERTGKGYGLGAVSHEQTQSASTKSKCSMARFAGKGTRTELSFDAPVIQECPACLKCLDKHRHK